MSMCYWMCEGIGIWANNLRPYLNPSKCIELIKEQTNGEVIPEEDDFDIDEYLYGEVFEDLGDMLCCCDNSGVMSYGNNGGGESFFFYAPSYPWKRRENEPESVRAVHEIIKDTVQRVTDMSRDEIEKLIDDDIYEYGYG